MQNDSVDRKRSHGAGWCCAGLGVLWLAACGAGDAGAGVGSQATAGAGVVSSGAAAGSGGRVMLDTGAAGPAAGSSGAAGRVSSGVAGAAASGAGGAAATAGGGAAAAGGGMAGTSAAAGAGGNAGPSAGSAAAGGSAAASGAPTFSRVWTEVLMPKGCTGQYCHGAGMGGLKLGSQAEAYTNLVGVAASGPMCASSAAVRVKPMDPAGSLLIDKLSHLMPGCGEIMPIGAKLEPSCLSDNPSVCNTMAEIALVTAWIEAGAKND
ncbi:MAG: hypothetical protein ABW321_35980 [Polyangiales bacterium]